MKGGAMSLAKWGWCSIGVNIVLAGIDLVVALYTGSLAVKAEILHNLVDLVTAVAVLLSLKIAGRKTRKFPYGLYKLENIVAVIMAMVIFFTAYEIGRYAILAPGFDVTVKSWHLVALALTAGIAFAFSLLELRAGKKSHSPALIADAREYRVHMLTSGVVFVALAAHPVALPLDRIAAVIVVIAVARTGWELLVSGIRELLDASLDPEAIAKIRKMILSEPQVADLHWITGRNAGRVKYIEVELTLRTNDLPKAEEITTNIENNIANSLENIERVVIHAEPETRNRIARNEME